MTTELELTRQERRSNAASPPLSPKLLRQDSLIDKKKEAHRELDRLQVASTLTHPRIPTPFTHPLPPIRAHTHVDVPMPW